MQREIERNKVKDDREREDEKRGGRQTYRDRDIYRDSEREI